MSPSVARRLVEMASPRLPEWHLTQVRNGMRIDCGDRNVQIDAWPSAGIWARNDSLLAIELMPMLAICGHGGSPVGLRMVRWLTEGQILPTPCKPIRMEAARTVSAFMSLIPGDIRAVVASAGDFQWRLIRLIARRPEIIDFLATEDQQRSWHYTLSALSFTAEDVDVDGFAQHLLNQPRRQFLTQLSRIECAKTVFDVFAHLPRTAYSPETYRWIVAASKTFRSDDIVGAMGIGEDPLPKLSCILPRQPRISELEPQLPPPPFSIPRVLEPLMRAAALAEEGNTMRNCVASYADRVREGGYYVYRWLGDERATVAVSRRRNGSWKIAEVKAIANSPVKPEARSAIKLAIEQATVARLVPTPGA